MSQFQLEHNSKEEQVLKAIYEEYLQNGQKLLKIGHILSKPYLSNIDGLEDFYVILRRLEASGSIKIRGGYHTVRLFEITEEGLKVASAIESKQKTDSNVQDKQMEQPLQRIRQPEIAIPDSYGNVFDAQNITSLSKSVCLIVAPKYGGELGTGFLVAPRLVLTNYHVINDVKAKGDLHNKATKLKFRFGYTEHNNEIKLTRTYDIDATNSILHFSESEVLDYALLQLAETPLDEVNNLINPLDIS